MEKIIYPSLEDIKKIEEQKRKIIKIFYKFKTLEVEKIRRFFFWKKEIIKKEEKRIELNSPTYYYIVNNFYSPNINSKFNYKTILVVRWTNDNEFKKIPDNIDSSTIEKVKIFSQIPYAIIIPLTYENLKNLILIVE